MPGGLYSNGLKVPKWALAAIVATVAVLGLGFQVGAAYEKHTTQHEATEFRLCRVEAALNIPQWTTCNELRRKFIDNGTVSGPGDE